MLRQLHGPAFYVSTPTEVANMHDEKSCHESWESVRREVKKRKGERVEFEMPNVHYSIVSDHVIFDYFIV